MYHKECPDLKEANYRDEQCRYSAQKMNSLKITDQMGFSTNNSFSWKAYYSNGTLFLFRMEIFCFKLESNGLLIVRPKKKMCPIL